MSSARTRFAAKKIDAKRTLRRDLRVAIKAPPCAFVSWASCPTDEALSAEFARLQGKEGKNGGEARRGCCADCAGDGVVGERGSGGSGGGGGFVSSKKGGVAKPEARILRGGM